MLDVVVGYYACCRGVFCVLWWISTTVVGYYAWCGGLLCLLWCGFLCIVVDKQNCGGLLCLMWWVIMLNNNTTAKIFFSGIQSLWFYNVWMNKKYGKVRSCRLLFFVQLKSTQQHASNLLCPCCKQGGVSFNWSKKAPKALLSSLIFYANVWRIWT